MLVGHDRVDGDLLEVLRRDDSDRRMEATALTEAETTRHLFDDGDVVLVEVVHAPEGHGSGVGVWKESQCDVILCDLIISHLTIFLSTTYGLKDG